MPVESEIASPPVTRSFFWSVVALATGLALLARFSVMAPPGFPLGEGGLFVLFSQLILDGGFALPAQAQYGAANLPFAYPPAGFYLAAAVSRVTGAELLDVYYFLPITLNVLAVPAFCYLARQFTGDRAILAGAALLYALLPESFIWQITGGGLPRALAALLSILAIATALDCARRPRKRLILLCGVLVGLAILSHLEWGMFAAIGVTFALITKGTGWSRVVLTLAAGAIALAVIAPWLLAVFGQHGVDPFLSSSSASQWNFKFVERILTADLFANVLAWPAILGMIKALQDREWFLLSWAPVIITTTPRMGDSSGLAIPTAILAAYGVRLVADFIQGEAARELLPGAAARLFDGSRSRFGMRLGTLAVLAITLAVLASPLRWIFIDRRIVEQIDPQSRAAMAWIARNTSPDSRFVVVSDANNWWGDRIAEWFPVLTRRASLTTAQGLEWAGKGVFVSKLAEIELFKAVQSGSPEFLPRFIRGYYCRASYLALFPASPKLRAAFAQSDARLVFENQQAAIYEVTAATNRCGYETHPPLTGNPPRAAQATAVRGAQE